MSISKLNFEVMFYTHRSISDPRTVNFISVLPFIPKEPGNGQDIIGKMSMPAFQIIYQNVKSTYICVYDQPGNEATLVKQMVEFRSCFVRAVKVHSAFPQVSSEPVAKVKFYSVNPVPV
ncbi:hypothetical protein DY000_02022822 [Brassica cretica]|uniref:Uncharacterized protein n=1 Tax=Brassica cretica TaxID=69181 RepID=A0ABQ7EIF7_BRACR|nr:hypothetical protein DY000_02022822 [Brassica cretica]